MISRRPIEGIPAGIVAHAQPTIPNEIQLSGLLLWLPARVAGSVTLAADKVTTWTDQSGAAYAFTQGTDANRPTYTTDGSTPALFYDTGAHWLALGFTAALNTAATTQVVFCRHTDYAALRTIGIQRTTGQFTWTQNSTTEFVTRTSGISASTSQVTNRTMRVLTISSGNVATTYKDSTVTQVQTGTVGATPGGGTHHIGVNSDVSASMLGYIYEIAQYDRVLTNDELLALGQYGVRNFGIT
jgi:hypothetical protein